MTDFNANAGEVDIFEDDSTKPTSSWFAFDSVGDSISGVLAFEPEKKEGKFGDQMVYVLNMETSTNPAYKKGDEVVVALKMTTHKAQIQQLRSADVGDSVGFRFKDLVDTGKVNPAKSIEVRIRHRKA